MTPVNCFKQSEPRPAGMPVRRAQKGSVAILRVGLGRLLLKRDRYSLSVPSINSHARVRRRAGEDCKDPGLTMVERARVPDMLFAEDTAQLMHRVKRRSRPAGLSRMRIPFDIGVFIDMKPAGYFSQAWSAVPGWLQPAGV
jgi:hypothetical protein